MAKPRFEIRRKRGGQFHFVLIGGNGQVVATSETYTSKTRARSGIASVQKFAAAAEILDLAEDARKPPARTAPAKWPTKRTTTNAAATSTGRAKTAGAKAVKKPATPARRAVSKK